MPDVGSSTSAPTKAPVKSSKSGAAEGGADGRKRFEVKKVANTTELVSEDRQKADMDST